MLFGSGPDGSVSPAASGASGAPSSPSAGGDSDGVSSAGTGDATGASVYTLSEIAAAKEAAKLASRENKADIIGGIDLGSENADVSSILIDLTQRETMNASAAFARLLGREAAPLMPLRANCHKMASLMVRKAPDRPSILFETGYISNENDTRFLSSSDGSALQTSQP